MIHQVGLRRTTLDEIRRAKAGGTVAGWIRDAVIAQKKARPSKSVGHWDQWPRVDLPDFVDHDVIRGAIESRLAKERRGALKVFGQLLKSRERIEADPLLLWEMVERKEGKC